MAASSTARCRGGRARGPPFERTAHIGIHAQKQQALHWIGVVRTGGLSGVAQMHGLAAIAREFGDGDVRLTVWQNLLISGVPTESSKRRKSASRGSGSRSETNAHPFRPGRLHRQYRLQIRSLRHQTPCRGHRALVEARVALDTPVNIHLTGCHHSCAQHFVAEIGLLACKVQATKTTIRSRAITF